MSHGQMQRQILDGDDVYLQIWQTEQDHVRTRWTVITFFLSVSLLVCLFAFVAFLCVHQISSYISFRYGKIRSDNFGYSE